VQGRSRRWFASTCQPPETVHAGQHKWAAAPARQEQRKSAARHTRAWHGACRWAVRAGRMGPPAAQGCAGVAREGGKGAGRESRRTTRPAKGAPAPVMCHSARRRSAVGEQGASEQRGGTLPRPGEGSWGRRGGENNPVPMQICGVRSGAAGDRGQQQQLLNGRETASILHSAPGALASFGFPAPRARTFWLTRAPRGGRSAKKRVAILGVARSQEFS